ncbi:MAG: hypothetical protein KY464_05135 [Gemmatimonadetes bacterium]|nr:hypothetical protein [Gemmatimonadota bacterium]
MSLPRVGLLACAAGELASLVRRPGGEPLVASAVREVAVDAFASRPHPRYRASRRFMYGPLPR